MNNVLIISLKGYEGIYSSANLINSIVKKSPNTRVEILIFEEFFKATKTINNLHHVHTINRKKINMLKSNSLFSNGLCLNLIFEALEPLKNVEWNQIINFSNNPVSSYVLSYLVHNQPECEYVGQKSLGFESFEKSNDWSVLYNNTLNKHTYSPIHFVDYIHKAAKLSISRSDKKVVTHPRHDKVAFENLDFIRRKQSVKGNPVKMVGVSFKARQDKNDIPLNTLMDFFNLILDDPNYYPVILITPTQEEQIFAKEINKYYNNALVVIEADLLATTSILNNIDILVTPDNAIKHLGDLINKPVVEVALNNSTIFDTGTINPGNLILTQGSMNTSAISGLDIINTVKSFFNSDTLQTNLPKINSTLYRVEIDSLGTFYSHVSGEVNHFNEISRLQTRDYLATFFNEDNYIPHIQKTLNYSSNEIRNWIKQEKDQITSITKDLLGTLRSLLQTKENLSKSRDFIKYLDKLFVYGSSQHLSTIPILIFCSKLETLPTASLGQNIKHIELLLYDLKMNIQKVISCVNSLEEESKYLQDLPKVVNQATSPKLEQEQAQI